MTAAFENAILLDSGVVEMSDIVRKHVAETAFMLIQAREWAVWAAMNGAVLVSMPGECPRVRVKVKSHAC